MLVNICCDNRLYRSCQSFVLNLLDSVGCKIVHKPFCVVASIVRSACFNPIRQSLASVLAPIIRPLAEVAIAIFFFSRAVTVNLTLAFNTRASRIPVVSLDQRSVTILLVSHRPSSTTKMSPVVWHRRRLFCKPLGLRIPFDILVVNSIRNPSSHRSYSSAVDFLPGKYNVTLDKQRNAKRALLLAGITIA